MWLVCAFSPLEHGIWTLTETLGTDFVKLYSEHKDLMDLFLVMLMLTHKINSFQN